jgi:hypothetical protein
MFPVWAWDKKKGCFVVFPNECLETFSDGRRGIVTSSSFYLPGAELRNRFPDNFKKIPTPPGILVGQTRALEEYYEFVPTTPERKALQIKEALNRKKQKWYSKDQARITGFQRKPK